jgi:hypothetical protein
MDDLQPVGIMHLRRGRLDLPAWPIGQAARRPVRIRIPDFPSFKPLELGDQFEIEQWVKRFPPYSDFNFVSLWSWNTTAQFEIAWLNQNLVVLFNDYTTGERFLSFIGTNEVDRTADALLDFAVAHDIAPELRLLPEATARAMTPRPGIVLAPAPEHDDYVLSTASWSALDGKAFRNKRNEISRLIREHAPVCRQIDLSDPEIRRGVMDVFGRWVVHKKLAGRSDTTIESVAVRRVFSLHRPGDLLAFGVFVDGRLVAYSINERLGDGYAMGHHWKADPAYCSAYPYMLRETCRTLACEGTAYLNIQQDLGDPGLALAKKLYHPVRRLHKYRLSADVQASYERELDAVPVWERHQLVTVG